MVAAAAVDEAELLAQMPNDSARKEYLEGAPWRDRDEAARRGTEVHSFAEQLGRGETVTPPEEIRGHVESYVRFLEEWEPEVVAVERWGFNRRHHYAGTFDLLAWLPTGSGGELELWLLDIKTTRSGVFGETVLQLAAYRGFEFYISERDGEEAPMEQVHRTGVVWVRADDYDVIEVDTSDPEMFRTFLYCAEVSKRTAKPWNGPSPLEELIGQPLTPPGESP